MQGETQAPIITKKSSLSWYISLIFLVGVIASSVGLFFYDQYLSHALETTSESIEKKQSEIDAISKDRDIIITKIVTSNAMRPSLDLVSLVARFREAASTAWVRLKGFSVDHDTITTTLTATQGDPNGHPDPASTIIRMMREYASGQKYFLLDPIVSLSGNETSRTTGISFRVHPLR